MRLQKKSVSGPQVPLFFFVPDIERIAKQGAMCICVRETTDDDSDVLKIFVCACVCDSSSLSLDLVVFRTILSLWILDFHTHTTVLVQSTRLASFLFYGINIHKSTNTLHCECAHHYTSPHFHHA